MLRLRLATAVGLLVGVGGAAAAGVEPLLPAQVGNWQRVAFEEVRAPELERLAGSEAALLREYGSLRGAQGVYQQGASQWRVTLQEMQDRSSSYGAFTLLRAGGQPIGVGEAGVVSGGRLLFYHGNYFVSVEPPTGIGELSPLVRHLAARAGPQPSLPTLPAYLPRDGLVAGSDRYLLGPLALARVAPLGPGDWAGFAYGAEVEAGRYRVDGTEATLLLLSYPTPQIAAQRLRDFERLFNLNGTGDPLRALAFAKRSGTLLVLVSGVDSGQAAARLLNQVRYEAEISWSEPSDPRPNPNWAKTLLNIFIGTGLLLLFALLSGIAFGLVRVVVKRILPGKVFDRPEDMEIIRLDLDLRR